MNEKRRETKVLNFWKIEKIKRKVKGSIKGLMVLKKTGVSPDIISLSSLLPLDTHKQQRIERKITHPNILTTEDATGRQKEASRCS